MIMKGHVVDDGSEGEDLICAPSCETRSHSDCSHGQRSSSVSGWPELGSTFGKLFDALNQQTLRHFIDISFGMELIGLQEGCLQCGGHLLGYGCFATTTGAHHHDQRGCLSVRRGLCVGHGCSVNDDEECSTRVM